MKITDRVSRISRMRVSRRAALTLIHGEKDRETPAEHSRRVYEALKGRKQIVIVPGAGHNDCLRPAVWKQIDEWIATLRTLRGLA